MSKPDIEAHLVALGVPQRVAAYVAAQRPLRLSWLGGVGTVVVMIGGFAIGGLWLWPMLEARLDQNALTAARSSGALLYHHNFGVGLLIALFAWIGASGLIAGAIPILSRRLVAGEFYQSIVGAGGDARQAGRWGAAVMMRKLENEADPAAYVRRAIFAWVKPGVVVVAPMLLIAAVVTLRELNTYALFFVDRYEQRHTLLPTRTVHAWSGADLVEVGCNHVEGKNAGDDPIYIVHFKGGGSARIDGAFPVSMTWIDQVERIDAALVRAGARFEPWSWLGRDPHHPRCLTVYAASLGDEQYARFHRLIRAPELPR